MDTEYTSIPKWEAFERFDECLNEIYGEVEVCGYTYETARLLKMADPVAYRCAFLEFLDDERIQIGDEE